MVKISCVNYLNSTPFIYGLNNSSFLSKNAIINFDIPSVCAEKLISEQVDIGLVPVAIIPKLKHAQIISDYCISADGDVHSVLLLSEVPLHEIKTILLDFHSRTSVNLAKVLAKNYWNISVEWKAANDNFLNEVKNTTATVLIGDRTFGVHNNYKYVYDLAGEWKKFTDLPFVFAAWVTNKKIEPNFITEFNRALQIGLNNLENLIPEKQKEFPHYDVKKYLTHYIQYNLNESKHKAIELFLSYIKQL